tara:strand:+ start:1093 stop:1266 length:174 start_codon:yes stop_codon:yes gene_type:complete
MSISNAKYFKDMADENVVGIKATINGNLSWVPLDPNNVDYQAIQAWVAEGNTIAEAD